MGGLRMAAGGSMTAVRSAASLSGASSIGDGAARAHCRTRRATLGRAVETSAMSGSARPGDRRPAAAESAWCGRRRGHRRAPFKVVIHGPVSGTLSQISVSGDGWRVDTSATLQHDQTLVIDTAANTITKAGASQAGTLSRTSRLTARLTTGHQFITFNGADPTNTAYAVVTWLDTLPA